MEVTAGSDQPQWRGKDRGQFVAMERKNFKVSGHLLIW